ncbi:MAG: sulfatase-like hydrolase/transferase [Myxococcales bacterium]|nr:sulfatase-like hydrolase/transferase [Myxococcales bacterium]
MRARRWVRSQLPSSWKDLIPPRHGWIRLLTSFSTYVLTASAIATLVAKSIAVYDLEGVSHPLILLAWALTSDGLVYFGVAALLALMESRFRWAWVVTAPLALGGAITATLNTGYLLITGEQATWEAFTQLFARMQDVADITSEGLTTEVVLRIVGGLLVGIGFPLILRWELRRRRWTFERRIHGRARMLCAAWLAVLALIVMIVTPRPQTAMARNLGKNALLSTVRTLVTSLNTGSFKGYKPVRLVSAETIDEVAARPDLPNVVVVVLESTRYDKTSLSGREEVASTPNLEALAESGLVAHRTRAVLPHTTKSLFSILCGRFPLMQKKIVEVSSDLKVQCLPSILSDIGYTTAFMQSSWGTFEWRPRLVHRLGFQDFLAWEDIQGQSLGYLASDDESLVRPFGRFLNEAKASNQPFMVTLLTSATHHPYRLSRKSSKIAKEQELPRQTNEERYLRLIESEDRMLGGLLAELDKRKLRDNTIVVVVGDHGEGFGEKGVKQHDTNYYEEGLRVPLVMSGPGVPQMEVRGNASLVDVTPTLLALLGIPVDEKAKDSVNGFNLIADDFPGDKPRYFTCWFEQRCAGFVVGDRKVIVEPQTDEAWYYDLLRDPEESNPLALTRELEAELRNHERELARYRARKWDVKWGEVAYPLWLCAKGSSICKHPKAKKEKYRLEPKDGDDKDKDKAKSKDKAKPKAKGKAKEGEKGEKGEKAAPRIPDLRGVLPGATGGSSADAKTGDKAADTKAAGDKGASVKPGKASAPAKVEPLDSTAPLGPS